MADRIIDYGGCDFFPWSHAATGCPLCEKAERLVWEAKHPYTKDNPAEFYRLSDAAQAHFAAQAVTWKSGDPFVYPSGAAAPPDRRFPKK